jgi:putative membrane protein
MEYAIWWGPHWSLIVPVLIMILMTVCAVRMVRCAAGWRRDRGRRTGWMPPGWRKPGQDSMARRWVETPQEILDRRYASGEITKERYEQMKRDIESSSCSNPLDQQGA